MNPTTPASDAPASDASASDAPTSDASASDACAADPSAAPGTAPAPPSTIDGDATDPPLDRVALRVRSGLHEGALATLGVGSHLIGRAPHCDFVMHDAGIADEHVLLIVAPEGAHVRALADGALFDGRPLRLNGQMALPPGSVASSIRIGAMSIVLRYGEAHEGDAWPAAAPAGPSNWGAPDHWPGEMKAIVKRRPFVSALTAALLVAAGLGLALSSEGGWRPWGSVADLRVERARSTLASLKLPEVQVSRSPRGDAVLSGYVPDMGTLRQVRQAFTPGSALVSVYPADELVRFAREWMSGQGYRVNAAYAGSGEVHLSGSDTGKPGFEDAAQRLAGEVPGLVRVKTTITPLPAQAAAPPAAPKADEPYVLAGVSGVNAGRAQPYLTAGNTYIFRGGALKNGMTVVDIDASRVLVDDHGVTTTQEVKIR